MKFLKQYIDKYWKPFLTAVGFLTFETACDLLQPTIMSKIVDVGVAKKDMHYVLSLGGLMLLVTALGALAATGRNIISSKVSQKFGAELRLDLFKKIQGFSFQNIDNFEGASLVTRLTNDVNQVQIFVNGLMRIFVKAPLLCIGSLIMATRLNPGMSWILLIIVPVVSLIIFTNMKVGYPFFIKVQKVLDKVNGVIREYLSGVRVVKAFNSFDYEVKRFGKRNEDLAKVSTTAMRVMAIFSPGITLTVNLGIVAILWLGGIKVNSGETQVGQIIAFINYMTQILFSLMMISFVFTMFVRARASAERIEEVFNEENTMKIKEDKSEDYHISGRIDFNNVSFSYEGAKGDPVLKNITFTCMPGETIGIIGSTGSGKTSLINLIPRFYDASQGIVKVGGIDVKDMPIKVLRENIAVVPQKSVLFTGTVAENIRWGKEDAALEEVERAAEIADAHEFIKNMPERYNTMVGQGGVNFSGGQKQRLSIARAVIKKPKILILDDSTSAVDTATEARIRGALKKYSQNLSTILIAQKISSVMEADKIIVLDNGEIAGMGTHDYLINSCGIYQEIYKSQVGKEMTQHG
ncbi:ATP-binding cassette, subfamily B [Clostridium amylolyticum]|uniref:ATP-binding cassette, subfamily B n=1 Tax=Clostridium amylolyticum TaxID=1121298 RepID=A0A1M6LWD2_9CLOT|nr:ABC transporter ATP-binding protein [Clostridium amylolyticum]SHJ75470.1 ATP-binding cassette, subfamily B [Clostridium amylolyticum]